MGKKTKKTTVKIKDLSAKDGKTVKGGIYLKYGDKVKGETV